MDMKILVIDNYDSFVYNLVQYVGELGAKSIVYRNNRITLKQANKLQPERIILSPGPGIPERDSPPGAGERYGPAQRREPPVSTSHADATGVLRGPG